ncbi:hypothetical protein [Sinomonas halotolerans]|uniref:Antitoxin n=1 Tax=Sinomonas halotolerans TaxID=1644133 RepID=A0ABU9WW14_9MICC
MRTTLDLDPRVLAAARARVRARESRSVGAAVSELALAGLAAQAAGAPSDADGGLVLLPAAEGHVVTDEMVAKARAGG